jgi:menaquinone-9 beta-reductase
MPDVSIVGAGPAGSTAALCLARAGWSVTLIEQHPFPRNKVCGECLSSLGMKVLQRLGLADQVIHAGAVPLRRTFLHTTEEESLELALPQTMWGISRLKLDHLLLHAAIKAGATTLQPARCESLHPGKNPAIEIRHLPSNQLQTLHASWIILADGKAALLPQRPPATTDLGIKAHFRNCRGPNDAVELFGLRGSYVGLAPIENNTWNFACAIPIKRVAEHQGNLESLFASLLNENKTLAHRMTGAKRTSNWLTAPLPRFKVQKNWPEKILPLGNAAAAIEPIGGEGIGLAMRSAELATHMLIRSQSPKELSQEYRRLWRTRIPLCRLGAILLSSPTLSSLALPAMNDPTIGAVAMKLLEKD